MRKKRFSVEQMIGVLKQAEVGVPVAEVIRKAGISEQTFYRWKSKYAGLEVDQVRQMAQLQEENMRLKRLVLLFPGKRFRPGKKARGVFTNLACIIALLGLAVSTIGCGAGFALPSSAKTYTITVTGAADRTPTPPPSR